MTIIGTDTFPIPRFLTEGYGINLKQDGVSQALIIGTSGVALAVGDGVTDDRAALQAAINAGTPINGGGATYGVSGRLDLISGSRLENITLKQLSPSATSITLYSDNADNIVLQDVTVDMGGLFTAGTTNGLSGIRIKGTNASTLAENPRLIRVRVTNGGPSSAIAIMFTNNAYLEDCVVDGMEWNLTGITDDIHQSIWFTTNTNLTAVRCRALEVIGTNNGVSTLKYTRGFAIAGNTGLKLLNCHSEGVDQGYDSSGSVGNVNFQYLNCRAHQVGTWGFKFANTASAGVVANCIASEAGSAGFVVSGGQNLGASEPNSQYIQFSNCLAYNTGSNGLWVNTAGFNVVGVDPNTTDGDTTKTWPKYVSFSNCHAIDLQTVPTMAYGFLSSSDLVSNVAPNINVDHLCRSVGHTIAEFSGVNRPRQTWDEDGNHTFVGHIQANNVVATGIMAMNRQNVTLANGDNNNIAITKGYSRITGPTGAFAVTGFVPMNGDGDILELHNTTAQVMTIKNSSASSSAANRIVTLTGADVVLSARTSFATFIYDGAATKWILKSYN